MILVTGGARSGKSRHAEALIGDSSQVLYIATSQILDDEMAARIEHHRQGRPEHWRTVERWQHLDELIHADINPNEVVLLECVTTMVTPLTMQRILIHCATDRGPSSPRAASPRKHSVA